MNFYNPHFPKTVSTILTAQLHGNLSVERAWLGGYYGVADRFPVTRKGVCQVGIKAVLGDSSPDFRSFSAIFPIKLFL